MVSRLGRWCVLQTLLSGLAFASLAWNLLAIVLRPTLSEERGRQLGRWVISRGYQFFWAVAERFGMMELDSSALHLIKDVPGLVVVANHPSLLDAMLIVARLPRAFCIMKASLMSNPFLGAGAALARYLPNNGAFSVVKRATQDLRAGGQLLLFPEGTRTVNGRSLRLRPGFAHVALRAQAPVQVIFIHTDSPYLSKGWPLWRLPPLPIRFSVRLGQRFDAPTNAYELFKTVERHFWDFGPQARADHELQPLR